MQQSQCDPSYHFRAKMWRYPGVAPWRFVSLPKKLSAEISHRYMDMKRGFGSLRVQVSIGDTQWKTSIFPDSKTKSYLLPVKADVRKKEHLEDGASVVVDFEILL